jgi:hypothetical protein
LEHLVVHWLDRREQPNFPDAGPESIAGNHHANQEELFRGEIMCRGVRVNLPNCRIENGKGGRSCSWGNEGVSGIMYGF